MTLSANRPSPTLALSAATVAATVVGGALGLTIVRSEWFPTVPILLAGLGLIAVAGMVLIDARTAERPAGRVPGPDDDGEGPSDTPTTPADPDTAMPTADTVEHQPTEEQAQPPSDEQVHVALPVPSVQWWGRGAPSAHAAVRAPEAQRVPPPELETYLQTSIIAQCPCCGAFHLDTEATPPGYRFECRTCGFEWHWQPGRPWPAVQVNPRRRRPDPLSAAEP
jgi:hypothetical protein